MQPDIATLIRPAAAEPSAKLARPASADRGNESPSKERFARLVDAAEQQAQDAREQNGAAPVAAPTAPAAQTGVMARRGSLLPSATGADGKFLPQGPQAANPQALAALGLRAGQAEAKTNSPSPELPVLMGHAGTRPGGFAGGEPAFLDQAVTQFARTLGLAQRQGDALGTAPAAQAGDRALVPIAGESFTSALAAAPLSSSATASTSSSTAVAYDVQGQVGRPGWDSALSERLLVMTEKGINRASLRLHPQHLGPVEVSISMARDEVSVSFQAHNGVTREAIEQALPRLREMLGEAGLSLADTNVSAQQQQANQDQDPARRPANGNDAEADDGTQAAALSGHGQPDPVARHQRLLDAYA